MKTTEDRGFLLLITAVSLAFAWILWPLFGAVLWGIVAAILFAPLNRRLLGRLGPRPNLAALLTVVVIVVIVILPLTLIAASLTQEATGVYRRIQSGELDVVRLSQHVLDILPGWATGLLDRFGLESLGAIRDRLSTHVSEGSQALAGHALTFGQGTFDVVVNLFVMLYLLFFLFRDQEVLAARLTRAIPLRAEHRQALLLKFVVVVRATIKGNFLVALLQGMLGGLIFWFLGIGAPLLWAAIMAFLSLFPAIGAALVWGPVAIYLLATGSLWQGLVLIAYGALVIGLVDNLLRPILVGKDTRMPDYVVLISTLGGIATFGLNGFVVGPVIAAMFMVAWEIFSEVREAASAEDGGG